MPVPEKLGERPDGSFNFMARREGRDICSDGTAGNRDRCRRLSAILNDSSVSLCFRRDRLSDLHVGSLQPSFLVPAI